MVGSFRSGTSLLYSLLNQHPQVALMYECNVWDFPEPLASLRFRRNWLERQEFHNQALSRHRMIFGGRLHGLENVHTPEELYRSFSKGKSASLWGEKSPVYGTRLRILARRCPGCAFILLWRDPVEIYRSIAQAGRKKRFFRRPGLLNWLIYNQETMIEQAAELSRAGLRIHHVTYDDLLDRTEGTCRDLCRFLSIEFDGAMLDLGSADLSAVYQAPEHDHLRRGVIGRQHYSDEMLSRPIVTKLERFRTRWKRLAKQTAGLTPSRAGISEPGRLELLYHRTAGALLYTGHHLKRALFEFLPLPWLRTYRLLKNWFLFKQSAPTAMRPSMSEEWRAHWITILAGLLFLGGVAAVDLATGPQITLGPFYLIPCAALTLIVGQRWGTMAAAGCALILTLGRAHEPFGLLELGLFSWNVVMRFLFFQVIVVLLNRIRVELHSTLNSANGDHP